MLVRARGKLKTGNYLLVLEECPRFGIGALAQYWGGKPWLTCNELSDFTARFEGGHKAYVI